MQIPENHQRWEEERALLERQSKAQRPLLHLVLCTLMPFLGALYIGLLMTSRYRFTRPRTCLLFGPILGLIICSYSTILAMINLRRGLPARGRLTMCVCCWLALISSTMVSDQLFWKYIWGYWSLEDLNTYINIDPANDEGQTFMDAGQVYFKESTFVAKTKAVAYQDNGVYCVAPIIRQPLENQQGTAAVASNGPFTLPPSGTVDFWAVGINCCDPSGAAFTCGEVEAVGAGVGARAGVRLMRDDVRPFFTMAVQEWTAKNNLPARHPLFFTWVADPLWEVERLKTSSFTNLAMYLLLFCITNTVVSYFLFAYVFVMLGIR